METSTKDAFDSSILAHLDPREWKKNQLMDRKYNETFPLSKISLVGPNHIMAIS
jgi:hypothetical protein